MASSSRGGEHRPVHQDFIARIRYSNALPPPPHPPKLLDIPNTGLASGQYTAPGFASRLAREQPLNIEADAELGMPIDLVGMPGVFDGDESSIQAPAQIPHIHPHDRALLKPLSALGKPKVSEPSVSFLRRTEYISSVTSKGKHESGPLRNLNAAPLKRGLKRRSPEPDKGSPAYVKRKIDQSFSVAAANLKDRSRIKHPSKRNVKLVDVYPMIPDPDAFPDSGAYVTYKFTNNPVPPSRSYDTRLLSGLLKPIDKSEAEEQMFQAAQQAHEQDPENFPKPNPTSNYDYFLTDTAESSNKFRKRFDYENPDNNDDNLYTHNKDTKPAFAFSRIRAYETAQELVLDSSTKYSEELILSFNNDDALSQKALFYYPVIQKSTLRPQRTKNIARTIGIADEDEQVLDQLDVTVDDPNDELRGHMELYKQYPYGNPDAEEEEEAPATASPVRKDERRNGGTETVTNGRSQQHVDSDEDEDAEGDDEEA